MNPNDEKKESPNFERALFIALSRNNLLMPINEKQAAEFEERTGTTRVEAPAEFQESNLMFTTNKGFVKNEPKIKKFDESEELYLKVASSKSKSKKEKKK